MSSPRVTSAAAGEAHRVRTAGPSGVVHGLGGVRVRPARPTDEPALLAMIERCSMETVYRRFHGVFGTVARRELGRIANPTHAHRSWVAVAGGAIRGTASLVRDRRGELEVAIIVEDGWGGRGIGRALVEAALRDAARQGAREVIAWIQPENYRAIRFFQAVVPELDSRFEDGDVLLRVPVGASVSDLRATDAPPTIGSRVRTA